MQISYPTYLRRWWVVWSLSRNRLFWLKGTCSMVLWFWTRWWITLKGLIKNASSWSRILKSLWKGLLGVSPFYFEEIGVWKFFDTMDGSASFLKLDVSPCEWEPRQGLWYWKGSSPRITYFSLPFFVGSGRPSKSWLLMLLLKVIFTVLSSMLT